MNPEWLPEWWVQSAVCQWLMHDGRMLVPTIVHAAAFAIELALLREYRKFPAEQRKKAERAGWLLFFIHLLLVVAGTAALDGGVGYAASAIVWGVLVCALAARALRRTRHLPEPAAQADPYARHTRPDFARLQPNNLPKGRHESRMPGSH
jgi:hypothetical protein